MNLPEKLYPRPEDCYDFFFWLLHPENLKCPNGHGYEKASIHRTDRKPIVDYKCKICGKYFNIFTGTDLKGTKLSPTQLFQCFNGLLFKVPYQKLATQIGISRRAVSLNSEKMGQLADKYKSQFHTHPRSLSQSEKDKRFSWEPILRNIQEWDIDGDQLIVKIKNGGWYNLSSITYTHITQTKQGEKKKLVSQTSVKKINPFV